MISDGRVPGHFLRRVCHRALEGRQSGGAAMVAGSAGRGIPARAAVAESGQCGGTGAGEGVDQVGLYGRVD